MREIRTSGSVGAQAGDRLGLPDNATLKFPGTVCPVRLQRVGYIYPFTRVSLISVGQAFATNKRYGMRKPK